MARRLLYNQTYQPFLTSSFASQKGKDFFSSFSLLGDLLQSYWKHLPFHPLMGDLEEEKKEQKKFFDEMKKQPDPLLRELFGFSLNEENQKILFDPHFVLDCEHLSSREEKHFLYGALCERPGKISDVAIQESLEAALRLSFLEQFLGTKFLGAKRFSLEGLEGLGSSLHYLLHFLVPFHGLKALHVGLAHRGRLSLMTEVFQRPLAYLLQEFEGEVPADRPGILGDVKYHGGIRSRLNLRDRPLDLILEFNPSHLEIVSPVVLGHLRACLDALQEPFESRLGVLIHGDAAFAGQGVCYETFQLAQLPAYSVGGCLHYLADNQIGFTTHPDFARSTQWASDLGRAFSIPIFRVGSQDLLGLLICTATALAYRQKFGKDVLIHVLGYRLHGHQEADDPSFSQPLMTSQIKEFSPAPKVLWKGLCERRPHWKNWSYEAFEKHCREKNQTIWTERSLPQVDPLPLPEAGQLGSFSSSQLQELGRKLLQVPSDFHLHAKLEKFVLKQRKEAYETGEKLDWGSVELLTYASFLESGIPVRLVGQDVPRGTFNHRHVNWVDVKSGKVHSCFSHWSGASFYPSLLSEEAALAFEYGYSQNPQAGLVIWEAQFGDFVNGAQVVIDQFISSAREKWGQSSRLVLLLPHGYEGQGAEHTSARLERFLQLSADRELKVAYLSNSFQFYQLFRFHWMEEATPLILLTPKSFLRHPSQSCSLKDLVEKAFEKIRFLMEGSGSTLILCTGKVGAECVASFEGHCPEGLAGVLSLDLLAPFPLNEILDFLATHQNIERCLWLQEEPVNQGAFAFVRENWKIKRPLGLIARKAIATPVTGFSSLYEKEKQNLFFAAKSGRPKLV